VTTEPTRTIELSWQPEVNDYVEAFHARNRAGGAWLKIGVVALLGGVFAVAAFALGHPAPAMFGVEAAVLLPVLVPLLTWASTRALWKRRPGLRSPTRAAVSPAGITTDGPLVDMSSGQLVTGAVPDGLALDAVAQVLETKRVFVVQLVGQRGKRFLLLAKRGLAGPAELDALRTILAAAGARPDTSV
jgi:hypothetical protein